MYVRTITLLIRPGEDEPLCERLQDEVLPALRREPGFIDYLGLFAAEDPDLYVAMMFWETQHAAENYARGAYPQTMAKLRDLLTAPAEVNDFQVDTSTYHRIALGHTA